MIIMPIYFTSKDKLKPTREQLQLFYSAKFTNDIIISIIQKKYPEAGYYDMFKVSSKFNYYPILLDNSSDSDYDLFKTGTYITKEGNSYDLILTDQNNSYSIKIRNPKDEDNTMIKALFPIIFFGLAFIIQLLIPNSFYEESRNRKKR
jgi:hypothetical protein